MRLQCTAPSFFVIGPPRTGTTWLHSVLRERTILPRWTKETRFFDTHFHRGIGWYLAHYRRPKSGQCLGEIAPTYFSSREARERIARIASEAKVICIFRNPVDRLFSHYQLKRAYGMIPWTFEQAITRDPELLESGKYVTYLKLWQSALGDHRVLPTIYDDLQDGPQSFVDVIADFIGVPRLSLGESRNHHLHASEAFTEPRNYYCTRTATRTAEYLKGWGLDLLVAALTRPPMTKLLLSGGPPFAELPPELVARAYDLFRPEVEELQAILKRDLSVWNPRNGHAKAIAANALEGSVQADPTLSAGSI